MIYDTLNNLPNYLGVSDNLDTVIEYIMARDITTLPAGRTRIDGEKAVVTVSTVTPQSSDKALFQRHDAHIVLETDLEGSELFEVSLAELTFFAQQAAEASGRGLLVAHDGQLHLVDASNLAADPVPLGIAASIVGVEHGSGQAIIQRNEGPVALDLTTLDEEPLPFPTELEGLGVLGEMATTAGGGTLRQLTELNAQGVPTSQTIVEVSAAGEVNELISFDDPGDGILQLCASPSGRYAAVILAPDLVNNPYDMYKRPLPENRQTHIIDTTDGSVVTRLQGADISWCDWAL